MISRVHKVKLINRVRVTSVFVLYSMYLLFSFRFELYYWILDKTNIIWHLYSRMWILDIVSSSSNSNSELCHRRWANTGEEEEIIFFFGWSEVGWPGTNNTEVKQVAHLPVWKVLQTTWRIVYFSFSFIPKYKAILKR